MTIRHLKIFLEVARSKKMSLAAAKLYITQPTVSQAVQELENHYGVRLLERYPKGIFLTDAGKVLEKHAEEVLNAYENLDRTMTKMVNFHSIIIGATVTCGTCVIGSIIEEMERRNPLIKSNVIINNTEIIEEKILQNKIDVALVEGIIKSPDIISTPVIDDYLVLVCSVNHPFAKRKFVSLDELASENFILREKGSGTRKLFLDFMENSGSKVNIIWECNNSEAIKGAVESNRGLTVISIRLVAKEIKEGSVCVVNVQNLIWKRYFSIAIHKNKFISKDIELFMDVLKHYDDNIHSMLPEEIIENKNYNCIK